MIRTASLLAIGAYAGSWDYPYNAEEWGSYCLSGKSQSPIDLPAFGSNEQDEEITYLKGSDTDALKATQAFAAYGGVTAGGHGLGFKCSSGFKMLQPGTARSYDLLQFHVHTGSEHFVEGKQYDMEMHFVHSRTGKPVSVGPDGDLAVVGVFFEVVEEGQAPPESVKAIQDLLDAMACSKDEGCWDQDKEKKFSANLDPTIFLQLASDGSEKKYWTYSGGLTTPGCTEIVSWHVYVNAIPIYQSQVDQINAIQGLSGNFRPPEPRNGRPVGPMEEGQTYYDADAPADEGGDDKKKTYKSSWDYPYNAEQWGSYCLSGKSQSPIDLPAFGNLEQDVPISFLKGTASDALKATQSLAAYGGITAGGHGLGFKCSSGFKMLQPYTDRSYDLLQFHVHTGSEHFVEGKQYDMEMHFVHSRTGKPVSVGPDGDLAVVGVFFEVVEETASPPAAVQAMQTLLDAMGCAQDEGCWDEDNEKKFSADLDPTVFLQLAAEGAEKTYWTYSGGLTTPGCTEIVSWHVYSQAIPILQSQVDAINAIQGLSGNFRPPEPLNGRPVGPMEKGKTYYDADEEEESEDGDDDKTIMYLIIGIAILAMPLTIAIGYTCGSNPTCRAKFCGESPKPRNYSTPGDNL